MTRMWHKRKLTQRKKMNRLVDWKWYAFWNKVYGVFKMYFLCCSVGVGREIACWACCLLLTVFLPELTLHVIGPKRYVPGTCRDVINFGGDFVLRSHRVFICVWTTYISRQFNLTRLIPFVGVMGWSGSVIGPKRYVPGTCRDVINFGVDFVSHPWVC